MARVSAQRLKMGEEDWEEEMLLGSELGVIKGESLPSSDHPTSVAALRHL